MRETRRAAARAHHRLAPAALGATALGMSSPPLAATCAPHAEQHQREHHQRGDDELHETVRVTGAEARARLHFSSKATEVLAAAKLYGIWDSSFLIQFAIKYYQSFAPCINFHYRFSFHVSIKCLHCSRISVVTMRGDVIAIDDASGTNTILSVKHRVFAANRELRVRQQRLVYRSGPRGIEPLANDETLSGAGVAQDGSAELDVLIVDLTEADVEQLGQHVS